MRIIILYKYYEFPKNSNLKIYIFLNDSNVGSSCKHSKLSWYNVINVYNYKIYGRDLSITNEKYTTHLLETKKVVINTNKLSQKYRLTHHNNRKSKLQYLQCTKIPKGDWTAYMYKIIIVFISICLLCFPPSFYLIFLYVITILKTIPQF